MEKKLAIQFKTVKKIYHLGDSEVAALAGVDMEIGQGESLSYRVEASTRPVELAALMVEGTRDDRCRLSRDVGGIE